MNVADQIDLFRELVGDDSADPRYSPAAALKHILSGRRWLARETRCLQVRDTEDTVVGTASYTLPMDVIDLYTAECGGRPLKVIRPENWRDWVGIDDTLQGSPIYCKVFARQLQLFYVPVTVETVRYHGWAYPAALILDGGDVDFTDEQAEASVNRAAWRARELDGRDDGGCKAEAETAAARIGAQFRPKGSRQVIDR